VLWEEQKLPILVLEVVSQTRRGEYTKKKDFYQEMGVLYYVIYNPLRKNKPVLEVYQLENGVYKLLGGEPVWLTELELGIGKERANYQGINREWLYWYDRQGNRYLTPEERIQAGQKEGQQTLILQQLHLKLGDLPLEIQQQIRQLNSDRLNQLGLALFNFSQIQDLNHWLNNKV
jgi:hypothetical protein